MRTWNFETPQPVRLRVGLQAGKAELAAWDGPATEVEVSALDESAEELVERTLVEERSGGEIVIEVPTSHGSGGRWRRIFGDQPGVRVVVRLPAGSSLDALIASADLRVAGDWGDVSARSASGSVSVASVRRDMRVRTASGDVSVDEVGEELRVETASGGLRAGVLAGAAVVTTASGDVRIDRAEAAVEVRTASGDLRVGDALAGCRLKSASGDQQVERVVAGRVDLDTVSGDVTIGVARGTVVHVDAQSVAGDLSSEIDLDDRDVGEGGDGPQADLRARTVSGDLRVRRAAEV